MVKEKVENVVPENGVQENIIDEKSTFEEKVDENDELLKLALAKANEKRFPLILWEKKDIDKEFLFQILSREANIVHAFMIKSDGKKMEVDFQIKPLSLSTQIMKLGIAPMDIFKIKYMGMKKARPDSEFENKSFIVWKFDRVTQIFHTTNH